MLSDAYPMYLEKCQLFTYWALEFFSFCNHARQAGQRIDPRPEKFGSLVGFSLSHPISSPYSQGIYMLMIHKSLTPFQTFLFKLHI